MYFGLYYDHKIDYLLIKTNYSGLVNNIAQQDDLITLKNNSDIIGFNIKNISNIFNDLKPGLNYLSSDQLKILKRKINSEQFSNWKYCYEPFIVGKIVKIEKVANSDKLQLCQVKIGNEKILNIICGAKNVSLDELVVVAQNGAFLPNGEPIIAGKVFNINSDAMICSAKELNLELKSSGILILDKKKYSLGMTFKM